MKNSKKLLLMVAGIITCGQQVTASNTVVVAAIKAAQTKSVDMAIHECVEKHLPHFKDLTILNLSNKQKNIEELLKDLLTILQNNKGHKYTGLQTILEASLKNVRGAIKDIKAIVKALPIESSSLIKAAVKDPFVNQFLG